MSLFRAIRETLARAVSGGAGAGDAPSTAPRTGDAAPPFRLPSSHGDEVALEGRRGFWTVLYFYPRDNTPGCTAQACAFRDAIAPIRERGCEVFGISTDSVERHRGFAEKHSLPFPLLADVDGTVARAYGAQGLLGFNRRWTYLIDPELTIRWINRDVDPALDAKQIVDQLDLLNERVSTAPANT
jgi:peroxiredoxin Q/BCP